MDQLEEELKCCVCLDFFDNPVVLPCSHNLCKKCIQGLFNSRNTLDSSFRCPKCRHAILSWRETIDILPENKVLKNVISIVKELRSASAPTAYTCSKHGLKQQYYCYTCKCTLCSECKLETHSGFGHNIEPVDVMLADKQEKAESSVMELKLAEKSLEDNFEQILDEKAKLKAYTDNLMVSVNLWFDQLNQELVFRKKVLARTLHYLFKDRQAAILDREASCKKKLSNIKSLIKCYEASQDSSLKPEQKVEAIDNLLIRVCSLMTFVLNNENYEPVMEPLPDIKLQGVEAALKDLLAIRWSCDTELPSDKQKEKQSEENPQQTRDARSAAASGDGNKNPNNIKSISASTSTAECNNKSTQGVKFIKQLSEMMGSLCIRTTTNNGTASNEKSASFSSERDTSHGNENKCNLEVDNQGNQASGGAGSEVPDPPFCATDFFKSFSDPGITWPSPGQLQVSAAQAVQPVAQSSTEFSTPGGSNPQELQSSVSVDSSPQKALFALGSSAQKPLFTLGSSPPTQRMQRKRTKLPKPH